MFILRDGKFMVVGSRFNYLHVWSIENKHFSKTIHLANTNLTIKDCCVLPGFTYDNKFLLVLCSEGTLDVYSIETGKIVANLNSKNITNNHSQLLEEQKISQIHCSLNGRFMCAATQDGCIQCYDFDSSHLKPLKVNFWFIFLLNISS